MIIGGEILDKSPGQPGIARLDPTPTGGVGGLLGWRNPTRVPNNSGNGFSNETVPAGTQW